MSPRTLLRSTAVALLLASTATAGATARPTAPYLRYDDALASVRTPGFAGVWVDSSGRLAVALTRPSATAARAARAEVARVLHRSDLATKPVTAHAARYSFRQLHAWYGAMRDGVFALPGTASGDIDERADVLRFAVADVAAATPAVARIAALHGVPAEAVLLVRDTRPTATSLHDRIRPLIGGLAIYAASNGCTLGVTAVLNGAKGLVTNSHCTLVSGAVNGHHFFQGPIGANPPVAIETVDPPLTSCGAGCRYSDTAFAQLLSDADYSQGFIARPSSGTTWNNTDTYRITAESEPVVGDAVSKVGATTGLTSGTVSATCIDTQQRILNQGFNVIDMHCQSQASTMGSAAGDSGSPVFRVTSGNDVTLVGILWGSSGTFSTVGNMQLSTELGDLSFCASGFSC